MASGFQITSSSPREITAHGSAAIAEAAFNTTIAASPNGNVFANLTDPEIPAGIANLIGAIGGLDNAGRAIPLLQTTPAAAFAIADPAPGLPSALMLDGLTGSGTPTYAGGSGNAFGPADFWTFYDETPLLSAGTNGSGTDCMAFVEDSNYLPASVALFDTTFGLAAPTITQVFPDTTNPESTATKPKPWSILNGGMRSPPERRSTSISAMARTACVTRSSGLSLTTSVARSVSATAFAAVPHLFIPARLIQFSRRLPPRSSRSSLLPATTGRRASC